MKIKQLNNKIKYYDLEKLEFNNFLIVALNQNFYSDFDFINYFKDKKFGCHPEFWKYIMLFGNNSIEILFKKYKKYLKQDLVCYHMKLLAKNQLIEDPEGKNYPRRFNIINEYFNEYHKYI